MQDRQYDLNELTAWLKLMLGPDFSITQHETRDGRSFAVASQGPVLLAFRGRLANPPPIDGLTPRGPKIYHDFRRLEPNG